MNYSIFSRLPAVALLLVCTSAAAEWRCDCTTITDSCSAQVTVEQNFIDVTSDTEQCSRVDYFVDGMPFVAVVVGGQQKQDWISRNQNAKVLVQSCQVCRDNSGAATEAATSASAASADSGEPGELQPLIEVEPAFPPQALANNQAGYVELAFDVNEFGVVENARVTASQPKGVFDAAALAAIKRWRYPAETGRKTVSLTRRLNFNPAEAARRPARQASPEAAAAAPATGPRSECVREDTAYNFGDMVEVGLINACDTPLIVFACAQGTGTYLGRWVCTDSERQQQVLVGQADQRTGTATRVTGPDAARDYRYTDNFFLTRAPNTQYWWLACAVTDEGCRDSARLWTRSLDKQSASVDPQSRSALTVARSY